MAQSGVHPARPALSQTYKRLPEIVRRWQQFREEALARGDGRQLLLGRPPVGCEVPWIRQEVLQVLKEPAPEGAEAPASGEASPVSALSPMAGASETSNESRARTQQQQQAAEPAQRQQGQRGPMPASTAPELQVEDLRAVRRASLTVSEYYDAREVCFDDDLSSAGRPSMSAPSQQHGAQPAAAAAGVGPAAQQPQATPPPPGSVPSLAAAALARGAHHRRGLSTESATSIDTPTTEGGQPRAPGSHRFWRRFNRDYGEWDVYWDKGEPHLSKSGSNG